VGLYIIPRVPKDTQFIPRTRREIRACEWFPLADLQKLQKDGRCREPILGQKSFFGVVPFVKLLVRWLGRRRNSNNNNDQGGRRRFSSLTDSHCNTINNGAAPNISIDRTKDYEFQKQKFQSTLKEEEEEFKRIHAAYGSVNQQQVSPRGRQNFQYGNHKAAQNQRQRNRADNQSPRKQKVEAAAVPEQAEGPFYSKPIGPNPLFGEDGSFVFRCSTWDHFQLDHKPLFDIISQGPPISFK